jgi:hypothetical protein
MISFNYFTIIITLKTMNSMICPREFVICLITVGGTSCCSVKVHVCGLLDIRTGVVALGAFLYQCIVCMFFV